jgi:hypothetical protein
MIGMRQIQTPNGMVLVPEDQAAGFGLAPIPMPESPVPDAAIAGVGLPESPVPAVAGMAPPVGNGLAPAGAPPQPEPTQIAPSPEVAPPPGAAPVAGAPQAQPSAAQPEQEPQRAEPAKSLSQMTYDDVVAEQGANTQEKEAAARELAAAEDARSVAAAKVLEDRNRAYDTKIADMEKAKADDDAEIERKKMVWQAKNDEWMNAKVTRRGISTGEMVMAAIAGFGAALKGQGDQNPALGVIYNNIQKDVDDQIRERDELGKRVGALKGSLDYAQEVATNRQAARMFAIGLGKDRAVMELEAVEKRTESPIKKAGLRQTIAEIRASATGDKTQALQLQHAEDAQKAAREQAERESRRSAATAAANRREDARQFDATDKRVRDLAALDAEKELSKAIASGDVERAKLLAAQVKEERELGIAGGVMLKGGPSPLAAIKQMNDLNRTLGIPDRIEQQGFNEKGYLVSRDGAVWKAPDATSAQALRKQVSATINASNMIDEVLRLRDQHGWSSDLLKSSEWRKMQANKGAIIVQMKNAAELGALSGPDMELIEAMLGTKDVTEFRDPTDGLRQAKTKMQENTRGVLGVAGYDGDAFQVVDNSKEEKAPRDEDTAVLVSNANAGATPTDRIGEANRGGTNVLGEALGGKRAPAPAASKPTDAMTRDQELRLESLVKRAQVVRTQDGKVNADADMAVSGLIEAATKGQNKAARDAAAKQLAELALAKNPLVMLRVDEFRSQLPGTKKR